MIKKENNKPATVRITSGLYKNKRLLIPDATRPVRERVKLAVFSILSNKILNADILDLFAGTGNLGFEALSRGANSSTFVENDYEAINLLIKNAENLSEDKLNINILKYDATDFVNDISKTKDENVNLSEKNTKANLSRKYEIKTRISNIPTNYDIVFIDAPYNLTINHVLKNLDRLMKNSSIAVYFKSSQNNTNISELNSKLKIYDSRKYGITTVDFIEKT